MLSVSFSGLKLLSYYFDVAFFIRQRNFGTRGVQCSLAPLSVSTCQLLAWMNTSRSAFILCNLFTCLWFTLFHLCGSFFLSFPLNFLILILKLRPICQFVFAHQVSLLCFGDCKHETFPCGATGSLVLACSRLVLVWRVCVCKHKACRLTVMFSVLVLGGACDSVVLRLRSQAVREGLLTLRFCSQSAIEHQVAAKNLEQCCSQLGGSSNNNKEDF